MLEASPPSFVRVCQAAFHGISSLPDANGLPYVAMTVTLPGTSTLP